MIVNRRLNFAITLLATTALLSACGTSSNDKDDKKKKKTELVSKPQQQASRPSVQSVQKKLQTELSLYPHAPSLTVIMVPKKNIQSSIEALLKKGGKLVYDPNHRHGSEIPFFIAQLTPDQINDNAFISSLDLATATIDNPDSQIKPIESKAYPHSKLNPTNFIPVNSVKLDALYGSAEQQMKLGKGVTVAVIDTGIDASHPAFNGRVDYWYDGTEETKTKLQKVDRDKDGNIEIQVSGKPLKVTLPSETPAGELSYAVFDEKNYLSQLAEETQNKLGFKDVNNNGIADKFLVVVVTGEDGQHVLFDANGSLSFDHESEKAVKLDYNQTTEENRLAGMVDFPSRNNVIRYPILLTREGENNYFGLGIPNGMHGTHVAGIVAANLPEANLVGAAPSARLMSLRACSEISCSDSSIVKALYQAFYNGKNIPDVVNISLGTKEGFSKDVYSYLFNDLSAKFGTIFFISASNSGPGFRTLNMFGNSGSVVMVGANVSKQTLRDQYNLPQSEQVPDESLLYFSSMGPSYTSEMKPNIVAPGAAISTVIFQQGALGQANGTSMSSPLAAGTMAAVLGKIKEDKAHLFENIEKLREVNIAKTEKAQGSLLPYVYAMRDAIQMGAEEIPHLNRAQQGYGLMHAGRTLNLLESKLEKLNNQETDYFEVVINNYTQSYDRTKEVRKFQNFNLTVGKDGERTKEQLLKILANGVDVILDRVEIINNKGEIKKITDAEKLKYFHILDLGDEQNATDEAHVAFSNSRDTNFTSARKLENMLEGHNYLAHYKVQYLGQNVSNILDVVHVPYTLKNQEIKIPRISTTKQKTSAGLAMSGQNLSANHIHRYPIYVSQEQKSFDLHVALDPETRGRAVVQVYDPAGLEVSSGTADNLPTGVKKLGLVVPTVDSKSNKTKVGIWEITLSTPSSAWLSSLKYDLFIENNSFGLPVNKVAMKAGSVLEMGVNTSQVPLNSALLHSLKLAHKQEVEVKSHHLSFHPIVRPEKIVAVIVRLQATDHYWGRLDHNLYTKAADGSFVKLDKVKSQPITSKEIMFASLPENVEVYYALDTITNFNFDPGKNAVKNTIETMLIYPVNVRLKTNLSAKKLSESMTLLKLQVEKPVQPIPPLEKDSPLFVVGNMILSSGKSETVIDASGTPITTVSDSDKNQKVEVTIEL